MATLGICSTRVSAKYSLPCRRGSRQMEGIAPAALTLDQRLVVVVRVADKYVVFVIREKAHLQPPKTADAKSVPILRILYHSSRGLSAVNRPSGKQPGVGWRPARHRIYWSGISRLLMHTPERDLPKDLHDLIEILAEHTYNIRAHQRLADAPHETGPTPSLPPYK